VVRLWLTTIIMKDIMAWGFLKRLQEGADQLKLEVAKYQNRDFLKACVGCCALIASADGNVDADEKRKTLGFIERNEALKIFDRSDVIQSFNDAVGELEFDFGLGKDGILKNVKKLAGKDSASTVVRLAIAIGGADGDFDDDEKKVAVEIARELGLNPADFELPT